MKNKLLFIRTLGLSLVLGSSVFAQEAQENIEAKREQYKEVISNHPYTGDLESPKKLSNGKLPPNLYFKQDFLNTVDPITGSADRSHLKDVVKKINRGDYAPESNNGSLFSRPGTNENPWIERGPFFVGGRTRALMYDPNDETGKRVFAGSVSGGLFVNNDITNLGSTWESIGDFWDNIAISCITSDPNNPQILYVGTGEVYTNDAIGEGIFRSMDGGQTWTQLLNEDLGYTTNGRKRGFHYITDLVVRDNNGTSELWIGVAGNYFRQTTFLGNYEAGLYKSVDNGETFEIQEDLFYAVSGTTGLDIHYGVNDIELGADNSIWVGTYNDPFSSSGVGGKVYHSLDGESFTRVYEYSQGDVESGRVEIAASKQDPNKVYIVIETQVSSNPISLLKTTDAGANWSELSLPNDVDSGIPANDFTRGQSFYDLVLKVHPTNDQDVYLGGIDLFRSTNGGAEWGQISKWSNNNSLGGLQSSLVHADQHTITFNPINPNEAIFGNDGGVYYTANTDDYTDTSPFKSNIVARNYKYNVTQFYSAALNPTATSADEEILAGAQDNGTQLLYGSPNSFNQYSSYEYTGGDGTWVAYDDEALYHITGYVYTNHYLTNTQTGDFFYLLPEGDRNYGHFINEMVIDQTNDIAYVYKNGTSFFAVTGLNGATDTSDLTTTTKSLSVGGTAITHLSVSPNTQKLFLGTNTGKIFKVSDAASDNMTFVEITSPIVGAISSISFGASEEEIAVTVLNFNTENVWYSSNGGDTWENKEGNLPDMPIRWSLFNPANTNEVLIATELGVWATSDITASSPTWTTVNSGLANVRVTQLDYRATDETILAATYGRGIFTADAEFLGANDISAQNQKFAVYPQPSKGTLHLLIGDKNVDKVNVTMYNTSGQIVYQQNDLRATEPFTPQLSTGVYILEASNKEGFKKTVKVMMK